MSIGNEFTKVIYDEIKSKLDLNKNPTLAIVQVGDDPASTIYIKHKRLTCEKLGFGFEHHIFDKNIATSKLINEIHFLNKDKAVRELLFNYHFHNILINTKF